MAQRDEIMQFLNDLLTPDNFDDYCVNGIQVEGKPDIKKIALGVSVSARFFQEAIATNADLLIVHHGLFWKSDPHPMKITGLLYKRLKMLIQNDLNLVGYHLPLDAHPEIGNNAQLVQKLALQSPQPVDVGFIAQFPEPIKFKDFVKQVNERLNTQSFVLEYGPEMVDKVVIISGGSSPEFHLAAESGAQVYLGGDIRENLVRSIEETGINFINAGHYNTEKLGIQALGQRIEQQFSISCEFIDIPNPV